MNIGCKANPFGHIPLASTGCIAELKAEAHKDCAESVHSQVVDGRREGIRIRLPHGRIQICVWKHPHIGC